MVDLSLDELSRSISEVAAYEDGGFHQEVSLNDIEQKFDEHSKVLNQFKKHGIVKIAEGDFRVVFRVEANPFGLREGAILKVSKNEGKRQNAPAVNVFKDMSDQERNELVASLLDWSGDYNWILQQKAYGAKRGDTKRVREKLVKFERSIDDLRRPNIGRLADGTPVIVDLGTLR